jgi:TFIIF-interacting CTD phosphatase-like protein
VLILFTSSVKRYADMIVKLFDPDNKFFSKRFYREACVKAKNGVRLFKVKF